MLVSNIFLDTGVANPDGKGTKSTRRFARPNHKGKRNSTKIKKKDASTNIGTYETIW